MVIGYLAIASALGLIAAGCGLCVGFGLWAAVGLFYGTATLATIVLAARVVFDSDDTDDDFCGSPVAIGG